MTAQSPTPETVILIDDENVYAAVVHAVKSGEPSIWAKLKRKFFGGDVAKSTPPSRLPGKSVAEIAPNGTGFTRSRRFNVHDEILNLLLIKPEDGQLFGWLTLAEFHERVSIKRVLCISRALSFREDLHTGELALVRQASALPYPALYASRPPHWQAKEGASRDPQHFYLSGKCQELGRSIADRAVERLRQNAIPDIHTGYARHPAWGGGMMPWASEQFHSMATEGLETISEIPVGVYDFATRAPDVPVVCFNIIAGRVKEIAAGDLARDEEKDPTRYVFKSESNVAGAVEIVWEFVQR